MVYPTDKDAKHIKNQSTGIEGYLEYKKSKKKAGKPTWTNQKQEIQRNIFHTYISLILSLISKVWRKKKSSIFS